MSGSQANAPTELAAAWALTSEVVVAAGRPALPDLDPGLAHLVDRTASAQVPPTWRADGNRLFAAREQELHPGYFQVPSERSRPKDGLLVLGSDIPRTTVRLWGTSPVLCIGTAVRLPRSVINCLGATIVLGNATRSSGSVIVDARNGGQIVVAGDTLWASGVRLQTDDMHSILDKSTGLRVNPPGGSIRVDPHVWIAFEALVLGSVHIGSDSVVGARSVVTRDVPAESVVAGVPARVIRSGVTWSPRDLVE